MLHCLEFEFRAFIYICTYKYAPTCVLLKFGWRQAVDIAALVGSVLSASFI